MVVVQLKLNTFVICQKSHSSPIHISYYWIKFIHSPLISYSFIIIRNWPNGNTQCFQQQS